MIRAMNPVEIDSVEPLHDARLRGAHLELPGPGASYTYHGVPLQGWVVGADRRVTGIGAGNTIDLEMVSTPLDRPHPSAVKVGAAAEGENCGFLTVMSSLVLEQAFEFDVVALLEGGDLVPFARVRGRRRPLPPIDSPLAPLLLSTVGRSGSTWTALLLSRHPEITAYSPIGYETRIGTYWMHVMQTLTDPRGFLSSLKAEPSRTDWWMPRPDSWVPSITPHPAMTEWLGGEAVEEVVAFCGERFAAFTRRFIETEGEDGARFFLEKHPLSPRIPRLLGELMPAAREIFLIRDFRDVACSIKSYNAKRGINMLGGSVDESDAEWVRRVGELARSYRQIRERRSDAILLRYEDLLREPEATLARVLEHVGVDHTQPTLAQMLEDAASTHAKRQERHATTSSPESSIGRFRSDMSAEVQAMCWDAMGEDLEAFGYGR